MKNKGFTLIELLAVIVILAIIALIATPIILNIIEDAREESNKRSIEMYASAVRNGIAASQLKGKQIMPGIYDESNLLPFTIEVDGKVECDTVEIYADGNIYLEGCIVNGGDKKYTYGEQQINQVYKPMYYSWDLRGTVGTTAAPENPSTEPPTSETYYLGYDVENGIISNAYICFKENGIEYCLKGFDKKAYQTNIDIIKDAYKGQESSYYDFDQPPGFGCWCYKSDLEIRTYSEGTLNVSKPSKPCMVNGRGEIGCYVY